MTAWQKQNELKKLYGLWDIPTIEEVDNIIKSIQIGRVDIQSQTLRARALFAIYYLTACRASEIIKTKKLRKRKQRTQITYTPAGNKNIIYELDRNKQPIIDQWTEEHDFLGLRKRDIRIKEYDNKEFLEIRTENRKNKLRKSKLLPIPVEKETIILNHLIEYIAKLPEEEVLFKFGTRRAAQIIAKTTGFNLHFIRHIRSTHLITMYDFNEQMLIKFMGWTDSRPAKAYMELRNADLAKEFYKR